MTKNLEEIEITTERFKIVESFPESPLSITDIQLDGKTISLENLVKLANQLASALSDRGCSFKVMK
jgi:hypothetical protein